MKDNLTKPKKKNGSDKLTKKTVIENIKTILGIEATQEHKFHPVRKWSFDVAIVPEKIAIEIEGGSFSTSRHTKGKGFIEDMAKYNEALRYGWKVVRITPQQVNSPEVYNLLTDLIWKE